MAVTQSTIIAHFIDVSAQISNWDFRRHGRLPQHLIDRIQLIRRWTWDNGMGPDELRLAVRMHQGADAAVMADCQRTMKPWQYYQDKQERRQRLEDR